MATKRWWRNYWTNQIRKSVLIWESFLEENLFFETSIYSWNFLTFLVKVNQFVGFKALSGSILNFSQPFYSRSQQRILFNCLTKKCWKKCRIETKKSIFPIQNWRENNSSSSGKRKFCFEEEYFLLEKRREKQNHLMHHFTWSKEISGQKKTFDSIRETKGKRAGKHFELFTTFGEPSRGPRRRTIYIFVPRMLSRENFFLLWMSHWIGLRILKGKRSLLGSLFCFSARDYSGLPDFPEDKNHDFHWKSSSKLEAWTLMVSWNSDSNNIATPTCLSEIHSPSSTPSPYSSPLCPLWSACSSRQ